ncbi:hypothetical protein V9T40_004802 [Parthenolecanium corni]|uniref:polo kinase n=1 Tax=Parthenolecanium corni TaxID=536013 RepID=A0AAN9TER3_9HEMI
MAHTKTEDVPIPEIIYDKSTGVKYVRGKFYGKGGFAKCYEIKDTNTNRTYAGKIVSKKLLVKSNQKEKMTQEITIHRSVRHKQIVGFHGFFEDDDFVYVILELCHRRSLMELHRRRKALTEPETRYYMKQILDGVLYLHENGIIHRDLKLGNLFLNDDIEVKIGDFGLAARIEYEGQRKKTLCGTPNYIAPEILQKKGHSFEVDVWSIGCIMYTLLAGRPPFETNSLKETYERIKRCEYRLPSAMKPAASKLINSMLQPDPKKRPTVKEILHSEFFDGYIPAKLPVSCLTLAPRFDAMAAKESMTLTRKPLIELNPGGNSPTVGALGKMNAKPQIGGNEKFEIPPGSQAVVTSTVGECNEYLRLLYQQLVKVLKNKPSNIPPDADEMTDPAAQPVVWVSKWVDYSDKYGFGYQLCDDGCGVMFNDNSRIVLLANQRNVHYIERDGTENYYTTDNTPPEIEKKVRLLSYFRKYMKEHLMKAGGSIQIQESDQLSRIPYLHQWHRSKNTVIMQLTNGTLQMNFQDHTKIIMCPLMSAVTYIDEGKNFRTYRFSTIVQNGCSPEGGNRENSATVVPCSLFVRDNRVDGNFGRDNDIFRFVNRSILCSSFKFGSIPEYKSWSWLVKANRRRHSYLRSVIVLQLSVESIVDQVRVDRFSPPCDGVRPLSYEFASPKPHAIARIRTRFLIPFSVAQLESVFCFRFDVTFVNLTKAVASRPSVETEIRSPREYEN